MAMKQTTIPKWSACITIGLRIGYTDETIHLSLVKHWLKEIQEIQIQRHELYLSANLYLSDIVLSGQDEPHVNLSFINYPRFPADEDVLRNGVLEIAEYLMERMLQNRIVIAFDKDVVMLEKDSTIDPDITLNQDFQHSV